MTDSIAIPYDVYNDDFPIKAYRGETFQYSMTYTDDTGAGYDWTDHKMYFSVRVGPRQRELLSASTEGASPEIVLDSSGNIEIEISETVMIDLEFKDARYDIMVVTPDDKVRPFMKGPFTLVHNITEVPAP